MIERGGVDLIRAAITTTADFYVDVSDDLGDRLKVVFA